MTEAKKNEILLGGDPHFGPSKKFKRKDVKDSPFPLFLRPCFCYLHVAYNLNLICTMNIQYFLDKCAFGLILIQIDIAFNI